MITVLALVSSCVIAAATAPIANADGATRVTGTIIAIEPQGEWELGALDARAGHWLYPYAAAMIKVAEADGDSTTPRLAAGDTVAVWHVMSGEARNSAKPGTAIESSVIADRVAARRLHVGQTAVYRLRWMFGRWFFDPRAID